ncbi:MAG: glycosyltransferase family 4 protein [Acidobacteria bacterium]|nr:glycosyltransferase family 4 protein [Acidobacteriota bacterium]
MNIAYLMQEGGPDVREKPLSGPANHVWHVFKELQALGHNVRLLVQYHGRIWRSDDLECFEPVKIPRLDRGPLRELERLVRGIQSRLRLPYVNLFESLRFAQACCQGLADRDLLYERMGWMGYGGGLAARRLGIPLVMEANNGDFISELERRGVAPRGFQRWLAIELMRRAVRRASHVVATGQGHRERFIDFWRVEGTHVSVVENGSEVVDLLSRDRLRSFRADPAASDQVTIVFVGAFEPWHGILKLIPAMARVAAKIASARLVLIGTGTQRERIVQLIHESGLDERVVLTGPLNISQVSEYLAEADIGVAPYCGWMEFSGLKLFDYKSAGLAIVASGQNGQPATLKHGHTAWIVPPCDEDALSAAIIGLASDAALRRRMGQAARLEAEECHRWRHTALRLERILKECRAASRTHPRDAKCMA